MDEFYAIIIFISIKLLRLRAAAVTGPSYCRSVTFSSLPLPPLIWVTVPSWRQTGEGADGSLNSTPSFTTHWLYDPGRSHHPNSVFTPVEWRPECLLHLSLGLLWGLITMIHWKVLIKWRLGKMAKIKNPWHEADTLVFKIKKKKLWIMTPEE